MVLKKDRPPPSGVEKNSSKMSNNNEQPVTKRQRIDITIESIDPNESGGDQLRSTTEDDVLIQDVESDEGIGLISTATAIQTTTTPTGASSSPANSSSASSSSTSLSNINGNCDVTDNVNQLLFRASSELGVKVRKDVSGGDVISNGLPTNNEEISLQTYLQKQCLCDVSPQQFDRLFARYPCNNGEVNALREWPLHKLLQFLSNIQLLFDVYLKQNANGNICGRIKDICEVLILNEHLLINEVIDLCNHRNKYVQFISGKLIASFLVITKDHSSGEDCKNWLEKLVNNLFELPPLPPNGGSGTNSHDLLVQNNSLQKINFSLEIFKRIIEWKDIDIHPLGDDLINDDLQPDDEYDPYLQQHQQQQHYLYQHLPQQQQPQIENNYFFFNVNNYGGSSSSTTQQQQQQLLATRRPTTTNPQHTMYPTHRSGSSSSHEPSAELVCQLVESDVFDTTPLKCETVKILEYKWKNLLKKMKSLIESYGNVELGENLILTFLTLWESIISVQANLSVVDTHPFHAQLDNFELLLLNHNLSTTIYKQMLTLFNEALCYGSTLALQDLIPDETCKLAHRIINHVKNDRLLNSLPRRQRHYENAVSLIGYNGATITYGQQSFQHWQHTNSTDHLSVADDLEQRPLDIDKTLLQKIVLLVLKSVAVSVREMRSDSSDSSIDSNDYEAINDMIMIEANMREVMKKLESFIKKKIEFHPETHFSKLLIDLFGDQDDYLIEAMVCTLDVTIGFSFRNNAFPELVSMLNPVYIFLEFLFMIKHSSDLLLDLLVSNETCFLLYLLRFLKYINIRDRDNWTMFVQSCRTFKNSSTELRDTMKVLKDLRLKISIMVAGQTFPYDISPILRLLEICEEHHEGNALS